MCLNRSECRKKQYIEPRDTKVLKAVDKKLVPKIRKPVQFVFLVCYLKWSSRLNVYISYLTESNLESSVNYNAYFEHLLINNSSHILYLNL